MHSSGQTVNLQGSRKLLLLVTAFVCYRQFHDISLTVRGTPAHVKCYSYHASTRVVVNSGGWNAILHDLKPK